MTEQEKNKTMQGLTSEEVKIAKERFGKNQLIIEKKESFFRKVIEVFAEPMFLLLLVASVIYFILGEPRDGAIMLVFVLGIITIDVVQEWKTDKTLKALKDLSAPHVTVIRDGKEILINSEDLVPGDFMLISEGVKIPADGEIISCNDLCVDESSLTGEAEGVWKISIDKNDKDIENIKNYWKKDYCYAGTLVIQGNAAVLVYKIGSMTEYGKIGVNIAATQESKTPLQKQTGKLVRLCAVIAAILFVLVCIITFLNLSGHIFKDRIIESILSGITLAMAMIPEEFPVILTVFLSMGAWRLAKKQSLVRELPSVETLGAVSVLCVDKTGTITMNKMTVRDTWTLKGIIIFIASFGTYYLYLDNNINNATLARTMGLVIIFISNIILVQVNSSDTDFVYKSVMINIKDSAMWIVKVGTILGICLLIYTPISGFLKLTALSFNQLIMTIIISIITVVWYKLVKIAKCIA